MAELVKLVEGYVDFPSVVKHKLVARRLRRMVEQLKLEHEDSAELEKLITALMPFSEAHVGGGAGAPNVVDPMVLGVADLDKSLLSKLTLTSNMLVHDVLGGLVRSGEDLIMVTSKRHTTRVCDYAIQYVSLNT